MSKIILHFENINVHNFTKDNTLCFVNGKYYERSKRESSGFEEWLRNLNGFYSIVLLDSFKRLNDECFEAENIYIAVDRIRSKPLFYSEYENKLYVSDSVEWLRKKLKINHISQLSKDEFLLTGFVTGNDSLFEGIKQLQAGQYLLFNENINIYNYYLYEHSEPKVIDDNDLLTNELDKVCDIIIKRAIEYSNNRQIVIPLSGGYDSRLIATKLKQHNYTNIVTFTYGLPNNNESNFSKQVAKSLGLKWLFVEYNSESFVKELLSSDLLNSYELFASNAVSIPHIQDFYSIKKLLENKLIDSNAVIMPGHSADFVAGSHIPLELYQNNHRKEVIDYIIENHYLLNPTLKLTNDLYDKLLLQISKNNSLNNIEIANEFEKWDWQERQAKFIANSVRVYDYFKLDWWMPFWDVDFLEFWQKIPFILRKDHEFYVDYVKKIYNKVSHSEINLGNANDKDKFFIKTFLRNTINNIFKNKPECLKIIEKIKNKVFKALNKVNKNDLTYILFIKSEFRDFYIKNYKKNISINGILALYYINLLERTLNND